MRQGSRVACRTIFFGGGTPSLLTAAQVAQLLDAARAAFTVDADAEITMEANPGALEYERLDEVRAAGVNRLSMGAQSFDPGLLRWMGRIHSPEEIETAFRSARAAGFEQHQPGFHLRAAGTIAARLGRHARTRAGARRLTTSRSTT